MVKIIIGQKGTGKTKMLVDLINGVAKDAAGSVVCIEKSKKLTYDINYKVRLVETEDCGVDSYTALYGFIAGIMAADYDIHDIFLDGTLKIGGKDIDELTTFIEKVNGLTEKNGVTLTLTLSVDPATAPAALQTYIINK